MKKIPILLAVAILALILATALGCNKEVEKTEAPPKASQVKKLVLVNLGLSWDWYAVPPDPRVFWEYPRLEQVETIDVAEWEQGKDVLIFEYIDAHMPHLVIYLWQGEDTIWLRRGLPSSIWTESPDEVVSTIIMFGKEIDWALKEYPNLKAVSMGRTIPVTTGYEYLYWLNDIHLISERLDFYVGYNGITNIYLRKLSRQNNLKGLSACPTGLPFFVADFGFLETRALLAARISKPQKTRPLCA